MNSFMWDPFATLDRLDSQFDEIVNRAWGARDKSGRGARPVRTGFVPAADVVRDGDDVVVELELAGVDPKDVVVEVERGRLVVRGERTWADEQNRGTVLIRERRHGMFRREFALPDGVTADSVAASYDKGVLSVRLAGATVRRSTRIPVEGAPARPVVEVSASEREPELAPEGARAEVPAASEEHTESK